MTDRGVLVERLVEVAHTEQQQGVGVLRLEREVLAANRRGQGARGLPGEAPSLPPPVCTQLHVHSRPGGT